MAADLTMNRLSRRLHGDVLRESARVTRRRGDGHAGVELFGCMLSNPANGLPWCSGGAASDAIGRVSLDEVSDM